MTYLKMKGTELCNQLGAKVKAVVNGVEDFKLGAGTAGVAAVVVLVLLIVIF